MAHLGGGTVQGALRLSERPSPGLSPAGQGWIYFDQATNAFVVSENGGAYVPLLTPSTAGGWTDDGTVVRLTTASDAVSVGTSSPPASTKFHVVGDSTFKHVSLTGGQGAASAAGGNVTVATGAGGSTSGASGDLTLSTGTTTNGDGGDVLVVAAAGNGTDRNGGSVSVTCGASSGNGSAGSFIVMAGTPTNTGAAGYIQLVAGNAAGGATGGSIDLSAGGGGIDGNGGSLDFQAGSGGITAGAGGQVSIRSGSAVAGNDLGGDFEILAGNGFGSGAGGNVTLGAGSGGGAGAAGRVSVSVGPTEFLRLTPEGTLRVGAAATTTLGLPPASTDPLHVQTGGTQVVRLISVGAGVSNLLNFVTGSGTLAAPTALSDSDLVASIGFQSWVDGTGGYGTNATIQVFVDGTQGPTSSPGRFVLNTTSPGATSPTTRAVLTSAGRLGVGTTSPVATVDVDGSVALGDVATVVANVALDDTHAVVLVDASAGAVTVTLPSVSGIARRRYVVKKVDSSANAVVIAGSGADTVDGSASKTLAIQYEALEVVTNGTAWFVI